MKKTVRITQLLVLAGIVGISLHLVRPTAQGDFPVDPNASVEFIRGDSNDDGQFDIADPVYLLGYLFFGSAAPPCMAAADTDDNGDLEISDAISGLGFLFLGGPPPQPPFPKAGTDPTPDLGCRVPALPPLPAVGSLGGPDRELNPEEELSWLRGRALFNRPARHSEGLGPFFNGDSCRGCHLDPVIGGAGGADVDVVRFAAYEEPEPGTEVVFQLEGGPASMRLALPDRERDEVHPDASIVETRQTPSIFGLGLVERIPEENILDLADPDDADDDGISGRARMAGDRLGRFGHKAGVPDLLAFAADASFNELGLTASRDVTSFAVDTDDDEIPDPEMSDQQLLDLAFFCQHIAPPPRRLPKEPNSLARVEEGAAIFASLGCDKCHVPSIEGADGPVAAYSDFLLHDVADPSKRQVNEPGVEPSEFRTAPLWGVRDTAPYLHDGSGETIRDAILKGHFGEATAARQRFELLLLDDRNKLVEFLLSL